MGGRGVSEGKPCELLTPPPLTNPNRAVDFQRRIFRHGMFCKVFAGSPPHLCHRPPAEQCDHTRHPLEAPHNRTAGIDIGHAKARIRAGSSSHDRASVFPPSLAAASRRFCFAQEAGAGKPFALIDPYNSFQTQKRPSKPNSDGLPTLFLTGK